MNTPKEIPIERLRQRLKYDPETGIFQKIRRNGALGAVVTGNATEDYLTLTVDYVDLRANRVAWAMAHGKWPDGVIDHRNGNRKDNRISNLRDVTNAINAQNRVRQNLRRVIDLPMGVYPAGSGKFEARICIGGKKTHLGRFTTPEEAAAAYLKFRRENCPGNTL
jgi:hypothetical protein